MTSLQDKYGNWVFITPIDGLELTKEINEVISFMKVIKNILKLMILFLQMTYYLILLTISSVVEAK